MVYPIPNDPEVLNSKQQLSDTEQVNKKYTRKSKRKIAKKAKKDSISKDKDKFVIGMSDWAEQFTAAATWKLKHELAYWKSKAVSLEYENKILHDIIRKNCCGGSKATKNTPKAGPEFDFQNGPIPKMYTNQPETEHSEDEMAEEENYEEKHEEIHEENFAEEGDWEVSEEYIDFVIKNAKFKEDARRERERLKAQRAGKSEVEIFEAGPSEQEDRSAQMKELYGANWQKVNALEMSIQSHFINESDKLKPSFWPNIPFNFG